jgi:hypothetical protein
MCPRLRMASFRNSGQPGPGVVCAVGVGRCHRAALEEPLPKFRPITRVFYKELLEENPDLRPMFSAENQASGAQTKRLAGAILAYVGNLERLDLLGPAVTNRSQTYWMRTCMSDSAVITSWIGH